ncbi:DUF6233 domain-containing protein [Streptomyces sp. NPDC051664]|uniref:DUF6233 domain-containing protein n=1 Tax=Streptomyces sp. NPDC051664 TaxID=3365668 RepID=UPI0037B02186
MWRGSTSDGVEAVEHRTWVSPVQARPVPGVSYEHVPTHRRSSAAGGLPRNVEPAWTVQRLPHLPGHLGATLVHVIGCAPGGQRLDREQALTALGQPRTTACKECDAAGSLATEDEPPSP